MTQQTAGTVFLSSTQMELKSHATQFIRTPSTDTVSRPSANGLKDLSGQANHADLSNANFNSSAEIYYGPGPTTYYTTISSTPTLGSGDFTIELWFKDIGGEN